jgi:hypothetical protein
MVRSAPTDLFWRSEDPDVHLEIQLDAHGRVVSVRHDATIISGSDEITEGFLTALSEVQQIKAGGIEYSDTGAGSPDAPFPYDPDAIRVDTKQFNIGLIQEMINDSDINLSPECRPAGLARRRPRPHRRPSRQPPRRAAAVELATQRPRYRCLTSYAAALTGLTGWLRFTRMP